MRCLWIMLLAAGWAGSASAQAPFPGSLPGIDVGQNLPGNFEGSGAVWHPRLNRLFIVSDSGLVASLEKDGSFYSADVVAGDLEGITIADPNSNFVYLGLENPDSVIEYDIVQHAVTRTFDVSSILTGSSNQGLEALTFVPNAADPEGGLFHLGQQSNGRVYVFRLPIRSSATATTFTFIQSYQPLVGVTDISALEYDVAHSRLYAIFDSADLLIEMTTSGTVLRQWTVPGTEQEGLAIDGCEMFTTEDTSPQLWKYFDFPTLGDCDLASAQTTRISATTGGTVLFALRSSAPLPVSAKYLMLGSATGTTPGVTVGLLHLPLNPDAYFQLTATNAGLFPFVNTLGTFDAAGRASAAISMPPLPPTLVGFSLAHSCLVFHPVTTKPLVASAAETLSIEP